jgi:hypothetical protein
MEVVRMVKIVPQQIVNATPHEVKIVVSQEREVVVPSSGQALRLPESDRTVGTVVIEGVEVPLVARSWSLPELPETSERTVTIVSLPLLMSLNTIPERLPRNILFVAPDTGKGAIRNANGQIEATKQLITTEKLLSKFIGAERTETTVRIWFYPAAGDEISLSAVSIQVRSRENAAKIASLLNFAGLTVVVETGEGESFANFSSSRHRPLAEFVQDYDRWWERE